MSGEEYDQSVRRERGSSIERREKPPDVAVGERDLGVVAVAFRDLAMTHRTFDAQRGKKLLVQPVRRVRLDVMDPEQERLAALLLHKPSERFVGQVLGRRFAFEQAKPTLAGEDFAIVGEV